MRKIRIYICLALTLFIVLLTLAPAMATKNGDIKHLFPPDTAKGKGVYKDFSPPALDKGKAQGVLRHRLYDPASPGSSDTPYLGNGEVYILIGSGENKKILTQGRAFISIVDAATGEAVNVYYAKVTIETKLLAPGSKTYEQNGEVYILSSSGGTQGGEIIIVDPITGEVISGIYVKKIDKIRRIASG